MVLLPRLSFIALDVDNGANEIVVNVKYFSRAIIDTIELGNSCRTGDQAVKKYLINTRRLFRSRFCILGQLPRWKCVRLV